MKQLSVDELVSLFKGSAEVAVIDPCEEGDFAHAHLLGAANLPFSRLEISIAEAVPNRATPVVLVDDLSGPADRAARLLSDMGYSSLHSLSGGIAAWHASGLPLFSGINVPGKAFGEYVERHLRPPAISATELKRRLDADEPIILIDTRTPEEHGNYCIPGAVLCPNGELSIRALDLIAGSEAPVVIHCAGRTRSIIGAQTLIDLGVRNPVTALENGTIAWQEIGAELEHGANRPLPQSAGGRKAGAEAVTALMRSAGIAQIGTGDLDALQADQDRTTYLFDVRTAEEFAVGHLPGAKHVPGGQLIQNVDKYAIVRNARIVITDDDGSRAGMVAFWLRRMGHRDVHVLASSLADRSESGSVQQNEATEDQPMPGEGELVVDVRSSLAYRRGHLPGSWFLTRQNLERDLPGLPGPGPVAVISDDADHAALTARDLRAAGYAPRVLLDGYERWCSAGGEVETGYTRLASPPNDMWYGGEHLESAENAARENRRYIAWEIALIDDIGDDPSVRYLSPAHNAT